MATPPRVIHRKHVDFEDSEEAAAEGQLVPSDWNDEHELEGVAGLDSPEFVNEPKAPTPPPGDSSTRIATMEALQAAVSKSVRVITTAGPQAADPADDVIIIKQTVGAPFALTVDWSQRTRSLRVVDGKGDAGVNNISITPAAGQTQLAAVNYVYVIDNNGGSIILTPLPDGSGAY